MNAPDPRSDLFQILGLMEQTADNLLNEKAIFEEHTGSEGDLRVIIASHWRMAEAIKGAVERTQAKYEPKIRGKDH